MYKRFYVSVLHCGILLFSVVLTGHAQISRPGDTIICYGLEAVANTFVSPPARVDQAVPLSRFIITYQGVPAEARKAIDRAADIWAATLVSSVPIRVSVRWDSLEPTALAAAGPTTFYRDFRGAADPDIWYAVAMAEAISGMELNGTKADIAVIVNSEAPWFYGVGGTPPANTYDLVSVIMHELGHGLGFLSSAREEPENQGSIGYEGIPVIFDVFIENRTGQRLTDSIRFPSPSPRLLQQFTSNALFFDSPLAASYNGGMNPELFAPVKFDEGSSISHLDEFTYRSGNASSLMTPQLARREVIQRPGEVIVAMFEEMGWPTYLTLTDIDPIAGTPLQIYPNPSTGVFSVGLPAGAGGHLRLQLTDLNGRLFLSHDSESGPAFDLDLTAFPPGAYLLMVGDGEKVYRGRVVVSR